MKKLVAVPAAIAVLCVAGILFAQAAQKGHDIGQQISDLNQKLDAVVQNQAKLDTIISNQERMIQMLVIIRHR